MCCLYAASIFICVLGTVFEQKVIYLVSFYVEVKSQEINIYVSTEIMTIIIKNVVLCRMCLCRV